MKIRQILSKALSPKPTVEQPAQKKLSGGPPTYTLVESSQLGEGGYGKVYEAIVNGDADTRVAIKKIALTRVREESLHREVRIMKRTLAAASRARALSATSRRRARALPRAASACAAAHGLPPRP